MPLSPVAQYCIRKLLRQDIETLTDLLTTETGNRRLSESGIDKILNSIYLDSSQSKTKVEELELLTKLYQDLEKSKSDEATLSEIKRRIFQVLNFQSNSSLPSCLPPIVQEKSISKFSFYHHGSVRNGMKYQHEIYGEVRRFNSIYRLQAYQFAWALSEHEIPLIVTASPKEFMIWVSVRSPAYPVLLRHDAAFLKLFLFLHFTIHKSKHFLKKTLKKPQKSIWLD